jgi:hypothetical protein
MFKIHLNANHIQVQNDKIKAKKKHHLYSATREYYPTENSA